MQRKCLKCGHVHATATGDAIEACPQCGAIYSRVEAALAARASGGVRPVTPRSNAGLSSGFGSRSTHTDDIDVHDFAQTLRAQSLYPTFRSLVKLFYWLFIALAVFAALTAVGLLFYGSGATRFAGVIGCIFMTLFWVLIARLTSETWLMLADLSDAAVRIAAKPSSSSD